MKTIGIAVGRNQIKGALVDEKGSIVNEIWEPSFLSDSPEKTLEQLCNVINHCEQKAKDSGSELLNYVGISFPGMINGKNGTIQYIPQYANWKNIDLKNPVKQKTGFDVVMENDANSATLGEKWFGLGKNLDSFILITIGSGVGGGIVSNNLLLTGKDNIGGEIGHISIETDGRRCYCGNKGCLETYVSIEGLKRYYDELHKEKNNFELNDFFSSVASGSSKEYQIMNQYLLMLAKGIAITISLVNPYAVILSGKLSSYLEPYLQKIKSITNKLIVPPLRNSYFLAISPLKSNAYVLGAAALAFELNQITISDHEKQKMRTHLLQLKELVDKKTSELRKKERALLENNKRLIDLQEKLKMAFWASKKGIWDWNTLTGRIYVDEKWLSDNRIFLDYFDGSFCSWCNMIHESDFKVFIGGLKNATSKIECSFEMQYRMKTIDQQWIWILHQGKNMRVLQVNGAYHQHMIGTITNFTKQKEENEKLAYRANFDPLTGLPNRTLLTDRLIQEINRSERIEDSFAVFFMDIDNFKQINDSFGHDIGDEALKQIAKNIEKNRRKSDTFARIGGDEFLLIVLNTDKNNTLKRLSKKYLNLFSKPLLIKGKEMKVSLSMGVAIYPQDGIDSHTLVKRADQAMYIAKKRGKNNCCFFEDIK